jgi:hypothetical protein
MGIYDPFEQYLTRQPGTIAELSFAQIEGILYRRLPRSTHRYDKWWSNENVGTTTHTQYRSWQRGLAGAKVCPRACLPALPPRSPLLSPSEACANSLEAQVHHPVRAQAGRIAELLNNGVGQNGNGDYGVDRCLETSFRLGRVARGEAMTARPCAEIRPFRTICINDAGETFRTRMSGSPARIRTTINSLNRRPSLRLA